MEDAHRDAIYAHLAAEGRHRRDHPAARQRALQRREVRAGAGAAIPPEALRREGVGEEGQAAVVIEVGV
jgi:hypothetical protein